jgi:hypothetical protein
MTLEITPKIVSEYQFRCFCGAPVVTTHKTAAICPNCDTAFELRRVRKRASQGWDTASSVSPQDMLQLVKKPVVYTALYFLLLYDLWDLLHC